VKISMRYTHLAVIMTLKKQIKQFRKLFKFLALPLESKKLKLPLTNGESLPRLLKARLNL
jgi:hypothetical protein